MYTIYTYMYYNIFYQRITWYFGIRYIIVTYVLDSSVITLFDLMEINRPPGAVFPCVFLETANGTVKIHFDI